MFANYVEDNKEKFLVLLHDGERLCGEWMIKTHTISYHLKTDPFIVFDIIDSDNKRLKYDDFVYLTDRLFTRAGLLHIGEAVPTDVIIKILGEGYHGAIGSPEGVVYRYETEDRYVCSGKFVSNPLIGNKEAFKADDDTAFNIVPRKYNKYIKYCM